MKITYKTQNSVSITKCPFNTGIMVGSHSCGNCESYIDHKNESSYNDGFVVCEKGESKRTNSKLEKE